MNHRLQSRHHAPNRENQTFFLSCMIDSELKIETGRQEACSPTEHDHCRYSVWGKYFPEQEGKLKDNIGDVKDCQQPLILISHQMEVVRHSSYNCVANVAAIEKGKHI